MTTLRTSVPRRGVCEVGIVSLRFSESSIAAVMLDDCGTAIWSFPFQLPTMESEDTVGTRHEPGVSARTLSGTHPCSEEFVQTLVEQATHHVPLITQNRCAWMFINDTEDHLSSHFCATLLAPFKKETTFTGVPQENQPCSVE